MKTKKICKIAGCENEVRCKELCKKCYSDKYESEHKAERKEKDRLYHLTHKEEKKEYDAIYKRDHKSEIKKRKKQYDLDHKERREIYSTQYRLDHKEELKQYDSDHRKERKEYFQQYELEHKEERRKNSKQYKLDHREELNERKRQRKQLDPIYKLRESVSCMINQALHRSNGSKSGESVMQYLPYTIEELKQHLENQFEPWMTWDNHGIISLTKRTWNIDHIYPQSLLPFSSMKKENFLKCWALSNLRPLGAMENVKKGNKLI
jgi:hypothetical protein